MLNLFIGFLTAILVLDCLFLALLILIQLPKKEAGLGQAFGSSATDALFGAGSGTALTKMTKYAAGVFFVITFLLAIMNAQASKAARGGRLREALEKASKAAATQPAATPAATPATGAPPIQLTVPPAPSVTTSVATSAVTVLTNLGITNPPVTNRAVTNLTAPQPK